MQAATVAPPPPYPPPLQHPPTNGVQQDPGDVSDPHLHGLKRIYLGYLPPPQIIEICLTFEIHAPLHVKRSIWPFDLNAAIASLRASQGEPPQSDPAAPEPFKSPLRPKAPLSGDQEKGSERDGPFATELSSTSEPGEAGTVASGPSALGPSGTQSAKPPTAPQSTPIPHAVPPVHYYQPSVQPQYPHQPYGYAPPPAVYPHAPYYPHPTGPPAGYPLYSFPPYPSPYHPPGPGSSYHLPPPHHVSPPHPPHPSTPISHPATPPAPSVGSHPNSLFTSAPLSHNPSPQPQEPIEDLPSYEEMIVEALMDCTDPEGCVPKNLFIWMAERYPLQTNFRPSASQALQKAFKRGRLVKGPGGKYKLNAAWEGGSTSRRATRRPQTQSQTALNFQNSAVNQPPPPPPPFTHAPLHRGSASYNLVAGHAMAYANPAFPYPQAYPGYQQHAMDGTALHDEAGVGSDAWEAAQNILKAINFGSLLQNSGSTSQGVRTSGSANAAPDHEKPRPAVPATVSFGSDDPAAPASISDSGEGSEQRAALQAQLALLAVQLAEIAEVKDDVLALGTTNATVDGILVDGDQTDGEENEDGMETVDVPPSSTAA